MKKISAIAICVLLASCGKNPTCSSADLDKGMFKTDVLRLCGEPDHINYSGFKSDLHEQWVYPHGFPAIGGTYIYIDKGILTDVQW